MEVSIMLGSLFYSGDVNDIDIVSANGTICIDSHTSTELNVDLWQALKHIYRECECMGECNKVSQSKPEITFALKHYGVPPEKMYTEVSHPKWRHLKDDEALIARNQEVVFLADGVEILRLNGDDYENVLSIHIDLSMWNTFISALRKYSFINEDRKARMIWKYK